MSNTPNYNWVLPTVGSDGSTWGTKNNAVLTAIDAQVKTNANTAAAAAAAAMQPGNNLSDLASLATALTNLGLTGNSGGGGWGGDWLIKLPVVMAGAVVEVIIQGSMKSTVIETSSPYTVNFPTAFPNACWGVYPVTRVAAFNNGGDCWAQLIGTPAKDHCLLAAQAANNQPTIDIPYIAIGY